MVGQQFCLNRGEIVDPPAGLKNGGPYELNRFVEETTRLQDRNVMTRGNVCAPCIEQQRNPEQTLDDEVENSSRFSLAFDQELSFSILGARMLRAGTLGF